MENDPESTPLSIGLSLVGEAVTLDSQGNVREALKLYQQAVEKFKEVQDDDNLPIELKIALPIKVKEYEARIADLKLELLDKPAPDPAFQYSPFDVEFYELRKSTLPEYDAKEVRKEVPEAIEVDKPEKAPIQVQGPMKIESEETQGQKFKTLATEKVKKPQGRRGEMSLETALNLSKKAKKKDNAKEYVNAFILYTQALEFFSDAAKHAPGGIMISLNKTMKAYMDRAEKIKKILEKHNQLPKVLKPVFPKEETVAEYHSKRAKLDGFDGRIGPLTKKTNTNFWNDSRPLFFQVTLLRNIVVPGFPLTVTVLLDNRSSVPVESITIHLEQFNTTTNVTLKGTKSTSTSVMKRDKVYFREASKFPVVMSRFKANLTYTFKNELDSTECDTSTCFAREYELVIQCQIPRHLNVSLSIPIRIVDDSM